VPPECDKQHIPPWHHALHHVQHTDLLAAAPDMASGLFHTAPVASFAK